MSVSTLPEISRKNYLNAPRSVLLNSEIADLVRDLDLVPEELYIEYENACAVFQNSFWFAARDDYFQTLMRYKSGFYSPVF